MTNVFRYYSNQAGPELEFRSTRAKLLWDKWRHVWLLAWERQRRLHEHLMYLQDVERVRNFNWDDWRKRVSFFFFFVFLFIIWSNGTWDYVLMVLRSMTVMVHVFSGTFFPFA